MFDTMVPPSAGAVSVGLGKSPERAKRFPLEHEAEFAEIEAATSSSSCVLTAMGGGLIFHILLIAERQVLGLHPSFFLLRGAPVTMALLALVLLPAAPRMQRYARALFCATGWGAALALVAGLDVPSYGPLLSVESGLAALMLFLGWCAQMPVGWTWLLGGGMLGVDLAALAASREGLSAASIQSLFAPAFAVAFTVVCASMRRREAQREFLAMRAAAFAGLDGAAAAEPSLDRDAITGVGNRASFDTRLRAAWEHAATRRNSVALLMVSIDNLSQLKRDLGFRAIEAMQTQVAGVLQEGLRRADDMVARFDTHHFVVMLPGVGTDGATQIAERLRGCIEELVIHDSGKRHRTTVTIGVASLRAKRGVEREKLIECATSALDQAKQTGPNLVCVEGRGCLPSMA